jgi:hypothetical protein
VKGSENQQNKAARRRKHNLQYPSPKEPISSLPRTHYNLLINLNYLNRERLPTGILKRKKLIMVLSVMVLLCKAHTNTSLYNFVSPPKLAITTCWSVELQGANLDNYVL